ncbi:UDP-2-acetamido-3-amino-2,3-dideoxy-glucuronate N-acetyltransferase [Bradyrhizobium sp. Ghvi]|uniref:acyltransferase n=1 Tax=Bradyrhizobium sp. Ghvi TaxID=1855319 RepID=UPI0008DEDCE7|nr:acyltransferase [Bradyrhizobium sp. Ghvi]SFO74665.1 UDP-2-acetamido-3-amino-2,3-dideoxy-glucuronate N-acetyltransferase [Bradyrhizobium sp. Ghvi]
MDTRVNEAFVHPTAVIEPGAIVGAFTNVWLFSHVDNGAVVGENCSLGQNTYVAPDAIVGNACRIGNSVSVFGHVELGDFVFCAPYMVFTHISFPRAAINRHAVFKKTIVKTGTTFGANSTVVPNITVGKGTFLAAGSTLTKSTKDWSFMMGSPARHIGWVSAFGEKIDLPLEGSGEWKCQHTGDVYSLRGQDLERAPGKVDILDYKPGAKLVRMAIIAD